MLDTFQYRAYQHLVGISPALKKSQFGEFLDDIKGAGILRLRAQATRRLAKWFSPMSEIGARSRQNGVMAETHTLCKGPKGRPKAWASYTEAEGSLHIETYDPDDAIGYGFEEVDVIVKPEHFDLVRAALGGGAGADVLLLVAENGEMVGRDPKSFMDKHGIPFEGFGWTSHY